MYATMYPVEFSLYPKPICAKHVEIPKKRSARKKQMDLCFVAEVSAMYARIPVRSNGAPPEMWKLHLYFLEDACSFVGGGGVGGYKIAF